MNILVINDLHVGSNYALVNKDNIRTPFQEWVYPKYQDIIKYSKSIGLDYIVGLGDIVDGYAGKDSTTLWTTDVNEQVACAVDLLKKLGNSKTKIIGVGGSGYHRGKGSGFDGDRMVIEELGGKYNKGSYYMKTPHGIIQFLHVAKKNIKGEANQLRINNGEIGNHQVRFLVAGHLHRYERYEIGNVTVVHTPCWQYPTDFMQGFGVSPTVDIGCMLIRIDEFGIDTKALKFPIPIDVMQEMSGWEDVTEKQIRKRNKQDMQKLSQLTGVSTEVLQVIRKTETQRFNIPPVPTTPEVRIKKTKTKRMEIPKI
jgi:UDP-2,3-diacylglucosamine pyrophosphatase LpxH